MSSINISQLDYRNILVSSYKELRLSEEELVVLLLIDSVNKDKKTLITGEQLAMKMNLDAKTIDSILTSLMNKSFLSYDSLDGILYTSMELTFSKITDLFLSKITKKISDDAEVSEDDLGEVLKLIEANMKRSLSPIELDQVSNWFNDGVEKSVIIDTINDVILTNKRFSITVIDRAIVKRLASKDRQREGFSTVTTHTKRDIIKAMDEVNYDWVNQDE